MPHPFIIRNLPFLWLLGLNAPVYLIAVFNAYAALAYMLCLVSAVLYYSHKHRRMP